MININVEHYKQRLKDISIDRFKGRLPMEDVDNFCETIMQIAESLDNYKTDPEDVIELVESHVMMARIDLKNICTLSLHHLVSNLASDNWNNKKYYIERAQEICKGKETECPELNMEMPIGEIRNIYKEIRGKYR